MAYGGREVETQRTRRGPAQSKRFCSIHSSFGEDLAEKWYGIVRQVTCKIQAEPQAKGAKSDVLAIQKFACVHYDW